MKEGDKGGFPKICCYSESCCDLVVQASPFLILAWHFLAGNLVV